MEDSAVPILSKEDLVAYERDGVVLIRNVLSKEQIELGRSAIEAAITNAGPQAEFISPDSSTSTWQGLQKSFGDDKTSSATIPWTMFQDQFSTRRCDEMTAYLKSVSITAQIAATLMKSSTATFFYDHVICKRPTSNSKTNAIPWHQDIPYWSVRGTFSSVWFPLDEMPKESAVKWILGSHRWGLFQPRHFVDSSPYEGTEDMKSMPDIDAMIASGEAKLATFHVSPGDVLVFDAHIIHGSPGNTSGVESDDKRQSHRRVALRYGGDDAVFWKYDRETAIPTPDINHGLSHGQALACVAFPVMWKATS